MRLPILVASFMTIFAGCLSTYEKATDDQRYRQATVKVPGVKMQALFARGLTWAGANAKIETQDASTGIIVLSGSHTVGTFAGRFEYAMTIQVKDERFRVSAELVRQTGAIPLQSQPGTGSIAGSQTADCSILGGTITPDRHCATPILARSLETFIPELDKKIMSAARAIRDGSGDF